MSTKGVIRHTKHYSRLRRRVLKKYQLDQNYTLLILFTQDKSINQIGVDRFTTNHRLESRVYALRSLHALFGR